MYFLIKSARVTLIYSGLPAYSQSSPKIEEREWMGEEVSASQHQKDCWSWGWVWWHWGRRQAAGQAARVSHPGGSWRGQARWWRTRGRQDSTHSCSTTLSCQTSWGDEEIYRLHTSVNWNRLAGRKKEIWVGSWKGVQWSASLCRISCQTRFHLHTYSHCHVGNFILRNSDVTAKSNISFPKSEGKSVRDSKQWVKRARRARHCNNK